MDANEFSQRSSDISEAKGHLDRRILKGEDDGPSDRDILRQLGFFRSDTLFMSLNLTREQFETIQRVMEHTRGQSVEEALTSILEIWLKEKVDVQ